MKQRFSKEDINRHIDNCGGAGFPTNSAIGVMNQLRRDKEKLVALINRLRHERFFNGIEEINEMMDDVIKEVE